MLWLVGQYGSVSGTGTTVEGVADWAPDVLRKTARSFNSEASLVKLQALTLAAKLILLAPTHRTIILLTRYVLTLARYDEDWDVRDRARMLKALLVGAVAGVVSSNEEEGVEGNWNKEERAGKPGVVLRREQVTRVLFEGKTGTIEEEPVADARPLGTLSLVMESESLHLHDDDDDETVINLPEWLEQGINPALRDSDDDAPQVALSSVAQAISSQGVSSQRVPTPAGSTPVVLTPAGGSTPKDAKDWRDLNKFYASESESEEEEVEMEVEVEVEEEGVDEGSGNDDDSDDDEETSEDEEGGTEYDPSPGHKRTP